MADSTDDFKDYERLEEVIGKLADIGRGAVRLVNECVFPPLKLKVDYILEHKIRSEHDIEYTLDELMDCMLWGVGHDDFMRLNEYYATFNKEYAEAYINMYIDMFRSDPASDKN